MIGITRKVSLSHMRTVKTKINPRILSLSRRFITKTRLFKYTEKKMKFFREFFLYIFKFLLKTYIVGTS